MQMTSSIPREARPRERLGVSRRREERSALGPKRRARGPRLRAATSRGLGRADHSPVGDEARVSRRRDVSTACAAFQPLALSLVPNGTAYVHVGTRRRYGVHHPRYRSRISIPVVDPHSRPRPLQQARPRCGSGLAPTRARRGPRPDRTERVGKAEVARNQTAAWLTSTAANGAERDGAQP